LKKIDLSIIGSGIGGSLIASLNADKKTVLFEKDQNIGGCASTFKRYGNYYNAGATTLVGYEDEHILKEHFDTIGLNPNITKSNIAIRVIQNKNVIDRIKDFDQFLDNINDVYPNKNNKYFWKFIKEFDEKFWNLKKIYFGKFSINNYLKTFNFFMELISTYKMDIFKSADGFIKEILGDISMEYRNFIDAQLLITIQTTSKDISLLSMALGLSYPFHDVFYVNGGMGSLIEDIVKNVELKKNEEITKIIRGQNEWIISSRKHEYKTKKLILNSSIYQCGSLFDDYEVKKYYDRFTFSDQSAFVVYLTLKSDYDFCEHYQFIYNDLLPNCISNSFFVSFSKKDDTKLSRNGYSITISTHTTAKYWKSLQKDEYVKSKNITESFIFEKFLEYFEDIKKEDVSQLFSATSTTFNKFIGRYNCGGKAIGFKNFMQLPSCNTPFNGLYNVGDTVFAGQGWPGIALGVDVLNKELNKV